MSRHPEVKWAERADKVYLTVQLPDAKNPKVNLGPDGTFTFTATGGGAGDHVYELNLDLFDQVNVEESKINYGVRSIFCVLEKAEKKWWGKLLRGSGKPPHYVKVDWDKWADEDEDAGGDLDLGGMDFSNFGGGDFGGANFGGMDFGGADFGGAGGDDDDDTDDDEQEFSKPDALGAENGESKADGKPEEVAPIEKTEASSA